MLTLMYYNAINNIMHPYNHYILQRVYETVKQAQTTTVVTDNMEKYLFIYTQLKKC